MHWAAPLIGAPYEAGACGPSSFDCIGLVRFYFRHRHGIELPDYLLHSGSARQLYRFIRATGWRCVAGPEQADDVLTMTGLAGKHVGVVVGTVEGLRLLHAVGSDKRGQVVAQHLRPLPGYMDIRIWRRA